MMISPGIPWLFIDIGSLVSVAGLLVDPTAEVVRHRGHDGFTEMVSVETAIACLSGHLNFASWRGGGDEYAATRFFRTGFACSPHGSYRLMEREAVGQ